MRKQALHPRTAAINRIQKNQAKQARMDAITWLSKKFPQAFDNSNMIRPLKCGIMHDILQYAEEALQDGISRSKLRQAVVVFTRRLDYLACLKARESRISLSGEPVETVTDEDAARAALKIKKRIEKGIKNAKKEALSTQRSTQNVSRAAHTATYLHSEEAATSHTYYRFSEKSDACSFVAPSPVSKSSSVLVKHKPNRQFDPDAVARLKAKLGLQSQVSEEQSEA